MIVAKNMPPCWGVDTNAKLNPASVAGLDQLPNGEPISFIFRYVSLHQPPSPADITVEEFQCICNAHKALGLVQHVLNPGWVATAENGAAHGAAAAAHARSVGYPAGCHLGVDMEGIQNSGADVLAYLCAWIRAAHDAGFKVVVYWGYAFQVALAAVQALLGPGDIFWADYGPRAIPFTVKQHAQITVHGTGVDPDEDLRDGLVLAALAEDAVAPDPGDPHVNTSDPAASP